MLPETVGQSEGEGRSAGVKRFGGVRSGYNVFGS